MHLTALADPRPVRRPDGTTVTPKPLARKSTRVVLDAIAMAHRWAGLHLPKDHPSIALVFEGILRGCADEDERKAEPIKRDLLKRMIAATREGPADGGARGARDRLLLLVGWGAALRRSELVALDFGDCQESPRGLLVTIGRAKGDQRGQGALVGIERAADPDLNVLQAFSDWRLLRDDADVHAPLFTSLRRNGVPTGQRLADRSVPDIIAALVRKADPEAMRQADLRGRTFSGHSLRAGMATEAGNSGAELHKVMKHLRHSKPETTAVYLREQDIWKNAITGLAFGNPGQ
ncbi:site-specific integrase [Azospirillum soli]|uniref:site-specific integrase n=1 Tax=Azospirillum soli TaxID=1304799 RepID=UPI001AE8FDFE|nr:site-specific integrase [Azospirillum soli]MBP2315464.1 integrase [Azospirillum soli]